MKKGHKKKESVGISQKNGSVAVMAYTDGGCLYNPGGPGGYGVVIINYESDKTTECSEGYESTTNNRMEVMAMIRALEETDGCTGTTLIVSDSQYAINCAENNWKREKNRDLWERYDKAAKGRKLMFQWVRGHSGVIENERCDALASAAMKKEGKLIDKGYSDSIHSNIPLRKFPGKLALGGAMAVDIQVPVDMDIGPSCLSIADYEKKYLVNTLCAKTITEFYSNKITSFKAYTKIKTGGIDTWSRKKAEEVIDNIGEKAWIVVTKNLDDEKQRLSAGRWICRGLKISDAIRKVFVDYEISLNCNSVKKKK